MTYADFDKLKELDDLWRTSKPEMFDKAPDNLYGTILNPDLTEEEIEDAMFWKKYQRGIWLIVSPPGSGKDAIANMVAYKMKYYFGKTPLLDYKPCAPFGYYEFLDTRKIVEELDKMSVGTKAKAKTLKEQEELADDVSRDWLIGRQHMFRHSTVVLNEFPRYMEKRRNGSPMGILLSHLFTIWRHLDVLIIGIATSERYLDQRAFEELTAKVHCSWSMTRKMTTLVFINPVKFVESSGVLVKSGLPDILVVNIEKPQTILGGLGWKDLFNTEQDISLAVPKSLRREQ